MGLAITFAEAGGNRFILVDQRYEPDLGIIPSLDRLVKAAQAQGFPVDQIVYLHPSLEPEHEAHLIFYNQDGSFAEACGNGTRCAALWVSQQDGRNRVRFSSSSGDLHLAVESTQIALTLPSPQFIRPAPITLAPEFGLQHPPLWISLGNPHLVLWVAEFPSQDDRGRWGQALQSAFPAGVNVSFATLTDAGIHLRVWERGVGLTQSCGTAACATHISGRYIGFLEETSLIYQPGGTLTVKWEGEQSPLTLTGPALIHGAVRL